MIIKLTRIDKTAKLGNSDAIRVYGIRIDDTEWSRSFFANQTDVAADLENFGVGEWVNVLLKRDPKNNKYWNIVGFKEVSEEEKASEIKKSKENKDGKPSLNYKTSGKSSGWNGRTGEAYDRSASIYLAWEMTKTTKTDAQLKKVIPYDVMVLAEEIFDYIHDGKFGATIDDPLAPPA